ncbi:MAG: lytic transglycosylase domain-containing protein [Rhodobacteraceae bacterium]|nr:lytic transglycosylase domain-containing protein [Paracoccaceae bacterium]
MRLLFFITLVLGTCPALAEPPDRSCTSGRWGQVRCIRTAHFVHDLCQILETTSRIHGVNPHFFTRLIWQESRFDPGAVSPAAAEGIAQFIPETARLRGLTDAFNPALALEHSAQYLAYLIRDFGNSGLAAIAYNGGEKRTFGFVTGTDALLPETIDYVQIITGHSAQDWRDAPPENPEFRLARDQKFRPACHALARTRQLAALLKPKPRASPWGVQVAAGSTRNKALRGYGFQTRRCRRITRAHRPELILRQPQVKGRLGYFTARIGVPSRAAGNRLCNNLRRLGCACAVYRN